MITRTEIAQMRKKGVREVLENPNDDYRWTVNGGFLTGLGGLVSIFFLQPHILPNHAKEFTTTPTNIHFLGCQKSIQACSVLIRVGQIGPTFIFPGKTMHFSWRSKESHHLKKNLFCEKVSQTRGGGASEFHMYLYFFLL